MTSLSPETKAAILDDYVGGMSQKAVARKYGISPNTAHRHIHAAGISRDVKTAQRAAHKAVYDREFGLAGGHWIGHRGIQVWQPCAYASPNLCTINHQEISNAA